jgi:hypothetical protein
LSIMKAFIHKTEITLVPIAEEGWKTVHEFCNGRGNKVLNSFSRSWSLAQSHFGSLPKEREGISVMALRCPAIWSWVKGETCIVLRRSVRARRSCPATRDPFAAIRRTQCTVGALSLNRATWQPGPRLHTVSIMTNSRRSPASSRSKLVRFPRSWLFVRSTSALMSCGHSMRKTVGTHSHLSPMMMPPTPCIEASLIPTKSGIPITNSEH